MSNEDKTTKIKFHGRKFELLKELKPSEINYIKRNLGLYKRLELAISKEVIIKKARLPGWSASTNIGLVTDNGHLILSYPQGWDHHWCKRD